MSEFFAGFEKRAWGIPLTHKADPATMAAARKNLEEAGESLIGKLRDEMAHNGGLRKEIGSTAEELLAKWPKALLPMFAVGAALGLGASLTKGNNR